jgi:DNA primase
VINKETIDNIFQTARVEEVVGEFVTLKKRGVNLIGLCPFHTEKTPSFYVSPAKGIYKCFGCGKAGNSVNFLMEHEHYTYPDALRYLAKKYSIPVGEEVQTPEAIEAQNEKESLYVLSSWAQKYFTELLHNHPEGKTVGLSYFKERGFSDETIQKFQLGYSIEDRTHLTDTALTNAFKAEYLEKTGLTIRTDEGKQYDRFRGRVIFPIHNLSGRIIGFGGRVLKSDAKTAKYVNSPESEIYHKSHVLYGAFFAKKSIVEEDNCYLVEGYTDVISMHQAGIENVVASSGTSLTAEQIRLISRYTKNITVLYDGDAAGIKASLRGIDMILEEGLNVKIVLLPDGEDPDSYSKKSGAAELKRYVQQNEKHFVLFKADLLLKEAGNDPVKKAELIRDIVTTISKIPDLIIRAMFVKECSALMGISEQVLNGELNKIRRKQFKKETGDENIDEILPHTFPPAQPTAAEDDTLHQERDIVRLLLNYGNKELEFVDYTDPKEPVITHKSVAEYIVSELLTDSIEPAHPSYYAIFREFASAIEQQSVPGQHHFINHTNTEISRTTIEILSFPYELHDWQKVRIWVPSEEEVLKEAVMGAVYALKMKRVTKMIDEVQEKLKAVSAEDELLQLIESNMNLLKIKTDLCNYKGIVVNK